MNNSTLEDADLGEVATMEMPELRVVEITFYSMVICVILIGNILVIVAFFTNIHLRTKANVCLTSLAVADVMVGAVSVPIWLLLLITNDYSYSALLQVYYFCDILSGTSSIMNLTTICLERCYAIISPIKHRNMKFREYGKMYLELKSNLTLRD